MCFYLSPKVTTMQNNFFKYDITYIALENFKSKGFEITFEVFNLLHASENELVQEFISLIGSDELYQSLHYHFNMILSVFSTKKNELLDEYFGWKYSVYGSRDINLDYFLIEYDIWLQVLDKYLYQSHSSELSMVYTYLIQKHNTFKLNIQDVHKLHVKEQYLPVFYQLKACLLQANKEKFYEIVKQNLHLFSGDIFSFIEEVVNPLMYEIGYMWQYNTINVAKEHLATALTGDIIDLFLLPKSSQKRKRALAILSTVGDESHNLGLKILEKFLNSLGFDAKCLGSKISDKELIKSIYELRPPLVLLSVTLISNLANLQNIVNELKSDTNLFDGLLVVGGQALYDGEKLIEIKGADFSSRSLNELKTFLQQHGFNQ